MGVAVQWDNDEKTVIQIIFEGHWQWDDVRKAVGEVNRMIDSVEHPVVHLIANRGAATWTPGNYAKNVKEIIDLYHPRLGYRVGVVRNPIARQMFYIYAGLVGGVDFEYRFVNTLEEAREFLARHMSSGA